MANKAILVGNVSYQNLTKLECCHEDIIAIKELLEATRKYEDITVIEDTEADALKSELRAAIDKITAPEELFFYFTGHGHQSKADFFYCATNFDSRRPNETGLSTTELHTLLKLADAELVVKVIDACNSGTILVKSDGGWIPQNKDGFKNVIQISSCLDSQNALTGNPISLFTDKFRSAALRKPDGVVFYTDIVSTLRDEFMDNNSQTPFFVSQHTGREQFVDDAKKLDDLRKKLEGVKIVADQKIMVSQASDVPKTLLERLKIADAKVATPELIASFVGCFFDRLLEEVTKSEFADFFDLDITEHARFEEETSERFIIRVMSNETRADNFVTAKYSRKLRGNNNFLGGAALLAAAFPNDNLYDESWDLYLNISMARAQLRIALTPKYKNLKKIILVISCAPSLDNCYIFEIATEHALQDFGKFDSGGPEVSRRWWKLTWRDKTDGIVKQVATKLTEVVRAQLESAEKRISSD